MIDRHSKRVKAFESKPLWKQYALRNCMKGVVTNPRIPKTDTGFAEYRDSILRQACRGLSLPYWTFHPEKRLWHTAKAKEAQLKITGTVEMTDHDEPSTNDPSMICPKCNVQLKYGTICGNCDPPKMQPRGVTEISGALNMLSELYKYNNLSNAKPIDERLASETCDWGYNPEFERWDTKCGDLVIMPNNVTPSDFEFVFCPYCARYIEEDDSGHPRRKRKAMKNE